MSCSPCRLLPVLMLVALGATLAPPASSRAPAPAKKEIINSIGMKLKLIRAGSFRMGSPAGEEGHDKEEGPVHEVKISKAFYLGAYAVTQAEYKKVMGHNPSYHSKDGTGAPGEMYIAVPGEGADGVKGVDTSSFPVDNVSWENAKAFCAKLSALPEEKKAGRVYRLPTEAEWEYACRAGTSTPFSFGKSLSSKQANFDGRRPYGGAEKGPRLGRTCKVGSYPPNAWGLYDMHGNVAQWCEDYFDKDYFRTSPKEDPQGPEPGTTRALRGGAYTTNALSCRSAYRAGIEPQLRNFNLGFRVVCVSVAGHR